MMGIFLSVSGKSMVFPIRCGEDALPDVGSEKTNVIWGGNATVNIIPKKYRGLDRFEARKQIIKDWR
jgi:hypothetical protein